MYFIIKYYSNFPIIFQLGEMGRKLVNDLNTLIEKTGESKN